MAFKLGSKKRTATQKALDQKRLQRALWRADIVAKRDAAEKKVREFKMTRLELEQAKAEFERVRWLSSQFTNSLVKEYIDELEKMSHGKGRTAAKANELFKTHHNKGGTDIREIITFIENSSRIDKATLLSFESPLLGYGATSKAQMLKNKIEQLGKKMDKLKKID